MSEQELGFPSSWKAPEPKLVRDTPTWHPVRHVVKETLTVGLAPDLAPVKVNVDGQLVAHVARLAEVVVTSVDGGESVSVQGVTVVTDAGGRYFRLTSAQGVRPDLPADAPSWVAELIAAVENDEVTAPLQRCGMCGYAAQPDGRGGWKHTSSVPQELGHHVRLVGGVS